MIMDQFSGMAHTPERRAASRSYVSATIRNGASSVIGKESLAGRLYRELRRRIITGEIRQGSRLPEQKLADDLRSSRIPLREALSRLAADGFIETRPRRSAVVTTWTTDTVHHLFDCRLALETAAAGAAAIRSGRGADVSELVAALERSEHEMVSGDDLAFAEANVRFHQALLTQADNPLMDQLMSAIAGRMVWLFHLTSQRDHEVACREHRSIVDAVTSGKSRLAETLTYAHIETGRAPSLEVLDRIIGLPDQ